MHFCPGNDRACSNPRRLLTPRGGAAVVGARGCIKIDKGRLGVAIAEGEVALSYVGK
jgi:hypothetical protein